MSKKRIIEILRMLKAKMKETHVGNTLEHSGICPYISLLWKQGAIDCFEYTQMKQYIKDHRPKNNYFFSNGISHPGWFYRQYSYAPRIKFINKLIRLNGGTV